MIDLKISQQFGRIGLEKQDAQFQLRQKQPNLELTQTPADFSLEFKEQELTIDYTPVLESLGYGGLEFMSRSYVNKSQAEYLGNLEKTVYEGYSIGAIEKEQSIGEVIFQNTAPQEQGVVIAPLPPINISYEAGAVSSKVNLGGVKGYFDRGEVKIENFVFPKMKVFLEQEPYIKIESVGQTIDLSK
ncbi:MAG: hypothetical protein APF84_14835 [Gracilibacter sp. BRH_c7a]|nr:MAG: hypothetical protein APF84_14835 [Gracilibacter sp. BRH_c7a]